MPPEPEDKSAESRGASLHYETLVRSGLTLASKPAPDAGCVARPGPGASQVATRNAEIAGGGFGKW